MSETTTGRFGLWRGLYQPPENNRIQLQGAPAVPSAPAAASGAGGMGSALSGGLRAYEAYHRGVGRRGHGARAGSPVDAGGLGPAGSKVPTTPADQAQPGWIGAANDPGGTYLPDTTEFARGGLACYAAGGVMGGPVGDDAVEQEWTGLYQPPSGHVATPPPPAALPPSFFGQKQGKAMGGPVRREPHASPGQARQIMDMVNGPAKAPEATPTVGGEAVAEGAAAPEALAGGAAGGEALAGGAAAAGEALAATAAASGSAAEGAAALLALAALRNGGRVPGAGLAGLGAAAPRRSRRIPALHTHGYGLVDDPSPGRQDKVPARVRPGSYIVPADVVSGAGEGNTEAGARAIMSRLKLSRGGRVLGYAGGGAVQGGVDVRLSGGEVAIPPEDVAAIGGGNHGAGAHKLDEFVATVRQHVAAIAKRLPPPR